MHSNRSRIINIFKKIFLLLIDEKLSPIKVHEIEFINAYKKKIKLLGTQSSFDHTYIIDG